VTPVTRRRDLPSCMLANAVLPDGGRARRTKVPATAPLAQSAERLHGKYPVRNAVLTCIDASHTRPVCAELDALRRAGSLRLDVTEVTVGKRPYPERCRPNGLRDYLHGIACCSATPATLVGSFGPSEHQFCV
jgi:hypothetical protein